MKKVICLVISMFLMFSSVAFADDMSLEKEINNVMQSMEPYVDESIKNRVILEQKINKMIKMANKFDDKCNMILADYRALILMYALYKDNANHHYERGNMKLHDKYFNKACNEKSVLLYIVKMAHDNNCPYMDDLSVPE